MSKFVKSAAFPILIVVLLVFVAQRLVVSESSAAPSPTFSQLLVEIPAGRIASVTMKVGEQELVVVTKSGEKYTTGYPDDYADTLTRQLETADVQSMPVDPSREVNTDLLSPQEGFLTVKGPSMADVYLNGMHRGPTNRPLRVACGRFYLRLAPPDPGRYPAWIGAGETVSIPCRASTVFTSKLASPSEGGAVGPEQTGRGTGL